AQTTSSKPAINKTIQDISGSRTMGPSPVKEAFAGGLFLLFAGVPMAESSAVKGMLMLFIN
ncbi:hypothetical protein, partial [Salmonella enterica]